MKENNYTFLYKRDEPVGIVTLDYAKSMIGNSSDTVYWKKDLTSGQICQVEEVMKTNSSPEGIEKMLDSGMPTNENLVVKSDGKTFKIPKTPL